jgi:YegS/Rv2252/BmrU family lipid kinase
LGSKDWQRIETLLNESTLPYEVVFTNAKGDAIQLTRKGIKDGYRNFIVVGGDGTMNEVVNGCFQQRTCPTHSLCLSMITVGTGNDWGRMFGIPCDYKQAIEVIKAKKTCLHDAGLIHFHIGNERDKRYFINIAGLGFDALVARRTNRQKEKGRKGKALYFWNLLSSLMLYGHTHTDYMIDGQKFSNKIFTMSLGIGRYSGGGMMQTPNALHDDGLFDVTVINKMGKLEVIRNLKLLYNGKILTHPKVNGYTGKDIVIDSKPVIHLEADGESLGHSPVKFKIIPRSINIVHNILPAN